MSPSLNRLTFKVYMKFFFIFDQISLNDWGHTFKTSEKVKIITTEKSACITCFISRVHTK